MVSRKLVKGKKGGEQGHWDRQAAEEAPRRVRKERQGWRWRSPEQETWAQHHVLTPLRTLGLWILQTANTVGLGGVRGRVGVNCRFCQDKQL